jgi:hypothetical protein
MQSIPSTLAPFLQEYSLADLDTLIERGVTAAGAVWGRSD